MLLVPVVRESSSAQADSWQLSCWQAVSCSAVRLKSAVHPVVLRRALGDGSIFVRQQHCCLCFTANQIILMQPPSLTSPSPHTPSSNCTSDAPIELFDTVLSRNIMSDPVIAADGFTYNRPEITLWLLTNNTSPKTQEPLDSKSLVPNM